MKTLLSAVALLLAIHNGSVDPTPLFAPQDIQIQRQVAGSALDRAIGEGMKESAKGRDACRVLEQAIRTAESADDIEAAHECWTLQYLAWREQIMD